MPGSVLPTHLASLTLFREHDGSVEITVDRARGALAELGHKGKMHESGRPIDYVDGLIVEAADRMRARLGIAIPMILNCPACHEPHIDAPAPGWTNPPHRSHKCQACGTIWRPCDLPTMGVAAIGTRGKDDTWLPDGCGTGAVVAPNYSEDAGHNCAAFRQFRIGQPCPICTPAPARMPDGAGARSLG